VTKSRTRKKDEVVNTNTNANATEEKMTEIEEAEIVEETEPTEETDLDDEPANEPVEESEPTEGKGKMKKGKKKKEAADSGPKEMIVVPLDDTCPAIEVRREAVRLKDVLDDDHYAMSDVLLQIFEQGLFMQWGFPTWAAYVETELDFALRKANYCVAISKFLLSLKPEFAAEFRKLRWTTVRELTGVVTNENASEMLARVKGKTYQEVLAMRKALVAGTDAPKEESGEKLKNLSFKLSEDQSDNIARALARAEAISANGNKSAQLDMICTDFLSQNATTTDQAAILQSVERSLGIKIIAFRDTEDAVEFLFGDETFDDLVKILSDEEGDEGDDDGGGEGDDEPDFG